MFSGLVSWPDAACCAAGAGQTDFEFLLESKVAPTLGLLGLVNIDLSGAGALMTAIHVKNTAAAGVQVQVRLAEVNRHLDWFVCRQA